MDQDQTIPEKQTDQELDCLSLNFRHQLYETLAGRRNQTHLTLYVIKSEATNSRGVLG